MASKILPAVLLLAVAAAVFYAVRVFDTGALRGTGAPRSAAPSANTPIPTPFGQVLAVADGWFTIRGQSGDVTVLLASETLVLKESRAASAADISPGAIVSVSGALNADGTLTAREVRILPPPPEPVSVPGAAFLNPKTAGIYPSSQAALALCWSWPPWSCGSGGSPGVEPRCSLSFARNPIVAGESVQAEWQCDWTGSRIRDDHGRDWGVCPGVYSDDGYNAAGRFGVAPLETTVFYVYNSPRSNSVSSLCRGGGGEAPSDRDGSLRELTRGTLFVNEPPAPALFLAASSPVAYGASSEVSWSASGGAGYDACYLGGGQWGGGTPVGTAGREQTSPLVADVQYWYECHDSYFGWQGPVYASVAVTPAPAPPAPEQPPAPPVVSASPASTLPGETSIIRWSCPAGAVRSQGTVPTGGATAGEAPVAPERTTTYTITCVFPAGESSAGTAVTVRSPRLSLTASPSRVRSGGAATISWSAGDVLSGTCRVSSDPAGAAWNGESGAETAVVRSMTVFTLACDVPAGSVSTSVTVAIIPAFQEI